MEVRTQRFLKIKCPTCVCRNRPGTRHGRARGSQVGALSSSAAMSSRRRVGWRSVGGHRKGEMEKPLRQFRRLSRGQKVPPALFLPLVSLRGLNIGLAKDANENQTAAAARFLAGICLSLLICFPFDETPLTAVRTSAEQNTHREPQFLLSAPSAYLCRLFRKLVIGQCYLIPNRPCNGRMPHLYVQPSDVPLHREKVRDGWGRRNALRPSEAAAVRAQSRPSGRLTDWDHLQRRTRRQGKLSGRT